MRENLGLLDGLLLSEAVMLALARHIGRQRAHEVVYELCMDAVVTRRAVSMHLLLEDPRVNPYLGAADLDACSIPARYTGLAARFVDRVGASRSLRRSSRSQPDQRVARGRRRPGAPPTS